MYQKSIQNQGQFFEGEQSLVQFLSTSQVIACTENNRFVQARSFQLRYLKPQTVYFQILRICGYKDLHHFLNFSQGANLSEGRYKVQAVLFKKFINIIILVVIISLLIVLTQHPKSHFHTRN
ncbi:Hypothetical_protein [Hexamita inflata]|uniref:Hypothetical_protein n=1 Tax=Hexamita inflata TaxID=28002 RepID=A0AA86QJV3_9EUKA|nr:Hypothetical protein HINF_LOCUS47675 [Hexamita inflata]CAI9960034.1 Hypothetical protein HINF_LOCUS47679 [Hexamita inflata]CAI9960039.1 Hypothetical protein HINF_LOCUS47684 [Hexamita inflata]